MAHKGGRLAGVQTCPICKISCKEQKSNGNAGKRKEIAMKTKRMNIVSRFLTALVFTVLTLPSWGVAQANMNMFGNVAIVTENNNYTNIVLGMAHVATFNNPVTAMNRVAFWCGTPSATNPCLIKILPGIYNLGEGSLTMKPYVDIEGSGEDTTIITSAFGNSSLAGVVNGASNAEIRLLTVRNTDTSGTFVVAIANNAQSPKITHVTAIAAGGGLNCSGVYNSASSPIMTHVTASARGGAEGTGVLNTGSSPVMSYVTASASDGTFSSCGVCNMLSSSPIMSNVTATGTHAHFSYGVSNTESSSPVMSEVNATAVGGANAYGVYNMDSSPIMDNVTANASSGTNVFGVDNMNSSPTMRNVAVTATGVAVSNSGTSSPTLSNVTAISTGLNRTGMVNSSTSSATIVVDRSTFQGNGASVSNLSNVTLKIGASKLVGPVSNSGTITCANSYNGNYVALGPTCQ
jgi:hypothetical protein